MECFAGVGNNEKGSAMWEGGKGHRNHYNLASDQYDKDKTPQLQWRPFITNWKHALST